MSATVAFSPLGDSMTGAVTGALASSFQNCGGATSLMVLPFVKAAPGSVKIVLHTSVKGVAASGDAEHVRH